MGKKWLDVGDLDLIFKVTPALLNQEMDSGQTFHMFHWDN